ncbi:MAG TPA: STAS domain-containing protein [Acidimicrobiales bacterium]|nr:STAS domain-containing protein [Acidimicrobiales bacterium]
MTEYPSLLSHGGLDVEYLHPTELGFWAEIASVSADGVVLGLRGEVDVFNHNELDAALSAMTATRARRAFIDASGCTFMSVQAYAAIGQCASEFESLTLRTWLGTAKTVLELLGFDGVICLPPRACFDFGSNSVVNVPQMRAVGFGIPATQAVG